MKTTLNHIFVAVLVLISTNTFAQVGIGTNAPAASAALEVTSSTNNKGILIPRITASQKDAIINPAEGLMIYQTSAPTGFYYYTVAAWKLIMTQTDLDTKLSTVDATISLNTKVDKVTGKDLSSNDFTTIEKTKLSAISGSNTGDQDLSALATIASVALKANARDVTTSLASKVDQVTGKDLSSNDFTSAEKTKLAAIIGTNTGDQITITGNAGTATKLALPKNINGVAFDGSTDITVTADAETLSGTVAVANGGTGSNTQNFVDLTGNQTLAGVKTFSSTITGSISGNAATVTNGIYTTNKLNALAGTSSAELAGVISDETGSGALVLATSPTLVTPVLGAATGTSLSVSGQLTSSIATGTAPLVVTSTTPVANLNIGGNASTATNVAGGLAGSIPYQTASATTALLAKGTDGQILTLSSGLPAWGTASGGVPYTGATGAVNLGAYDLTINGVTVGIGAGTATATNPFNGEVWNTYNTAIGLLSLSTNTSGNSNTAIGRGTLRYNTTGNSNTASGLQSLNKNTIGSDNAAFGSLSLYKNVEGSYNTSIGTRSMFNNVYGNYNTAVGWNSLTFTGLDAINSNSGGNNNTSLGYSALYSNTFGNDNTAVGYNAFRFNVTGSQNTSIGSGAGPGAFSSALSNTTAIGYEAIVSTSNSIQLGNSFVTNVNTSGTLTAGAMTYPNTAGTNGYYLKTDGAGIASWAAVSGAGVPYTGATTAVDLGAYDMKVNGLTIGWGPGSTSNTNTALGYQVLTAGVGQNNTAVGSWAGRYVKDGASNTALGYSALHSSAGNIMWGDYNTAIGAKSLFLASSNISKNTAVGSGALGSTSGGDQNTSIGYNSGFNNTTGKWNTIIGSSANVASGTLENATALGYLASVSASNSIQLGNTSVTNVITSGTITASGTQLTSDRRLKTNIEPIQNSIETIMKLNPVHYDKKNSLESKDYDKKENGFIAQEIKEVFPYLVVEGKDKDKLLSVNYTSLIPILTKAIQDQQQQIDGQKQQIDELKKIIQELINKK